MTDQARKSRFANLEVTRAQPDVTAQDARPRDESVAAPIARSFGTATKDAAYYLRQATAQQKAGDHEKALRSYSAALGENPILHEAWLGQLLMLIDLGELREARVWADKALESFPDEPQILAAKSIALLRMGVGKDARELNDLALTKKGEATLTWLARGEIMQKGSPDAARECFDRALRLAAPHERALVLLRVGQACARAGRQAEAADRLQQAVYEDGRAAWSWYQLGLAQMQLGQVDRSQNSFARARELNPSQGAYRESSLRPPRGLAALRARLVNWWTSL